MITLEDRPRRPDAELADASDVSRADFADVLRHHRALLWRQSRRKVRKPPVIGWDDWDQEARIGLWWAWRTYDAQYGIPFASWAALIVQRHLITVARAAIRKKHKALNEAWSSDAPWIPDKPDTWAALDWQDAAADPALHIEAEDLRRWAVRTLLVTLTPKERAAWCRHVAGIRPPTGRVSKSEDNAWQRARRKFQTAWRQTWG